MSLETEKQQHNKSYGCQIKKKAITKGAQIIRKYNYISMHIPKRGKKERTIT